MSETVNDSTTIPAFKEWQIVCSALASGEQMLILRKGGIAEGKAGFRWQHQQFFLFPTQFHQQAEGVRGERSVIPTNSDQSLALDLWTETVATARISDWSVVESLTPFHIWTPEVIHDRFTWGDEPGLSVALVRVHRLANPWQLADANRRAFGGCRSWLKLPLEEWSADHAQQIAEAEPVIGDDEFEQRCVEIRKILSLPGD